MASYPEMVYGEDADLLQFLGRYFGNEEKINKEDRLL